MRLVRYNVAASLDGFIASPDGSVDWIVQDTTIDFPALYAQFSTFVMGRKTYDVLRAYGDENPLRNRPREEVVVLGRGDGVKGKKEYEGVTVVSGQADDGGEDVAVRCVKELKARKEKKSEGEGEEKDICVYGGGELVSCLLAAKLVDTVEVAIMPVMIGKGIKMVADAPKEGWKLKLDTVETLESGILMCKYTVVYS
jgi:dihydrofolate reductase